MWAISKTGAVEHGTPKHWNSKIAEHWNSKIAEHQNSKNFEFGTNSKITCHGDRCDADRMEIESSEKVFV